MAPKKQTCIEPTNHRREPMNWVTFFNSAAGAVILVMTTWSAIQSNLARTEVVTVKETVDKIKVQTDGLHTAAKLDVAISAEKTAAATKTAEDIKTAQDARKAYETQKETQKKAEAVPQ